MTHLSDTLRAAADAAGEPVDLDLDLDAVHARVDRRRRHRTRARAACCVVGVVAVLGAAGVAAGVGGGAPDVRAGETGAVLEEETTTTLEPTTSTETTTSDPTTSTSTTTEPAPSTEVPTTEAPPTTVAPPSTTAPEGPTTLSLEGSYVVHSVPYAGTEDCPAMAGGLEGTIAMVDGSTWTRSEHACWTIQDDVFRGEGTFALTAPDGSTLTGTSLSIADLPTNGVPYSLAITGGTGAYAGATGGCDLTVNITSGAGGVDQRQEGVITCTFTVGAGGGGDDPGSEPEVPEAV